ncbi:uncharacterized protein LOC123561292 isoform X3 [Mercenaria mercenaria]|uniref:uncharacterized protein LOC123561292 isoform X3 n=1 Tax=Mercenaria mercenaria TaxID=6596 RepID=UPI00234EEC53|nr:uncharacterized protein LOC123561292 isoform X3 [Mercenaria mercenaria]
MASPVMRQSPGAKGRPETDSVHDHMTRLRMKMVQQKIQNEKDRIVNRPPSEESTNNNDLENQARLQQAMLRRQELLDKIRREQLLNDENKRPRTYSGRRRYTPSPLLPPPSRRSLQDFSKYNLYNQVQDTYRSRPEMPQVKHVIEHTYKDSPRIKQYPLPPINQIRAPPPVVVQQPPPAQIIPMQQPTPQIIAGPAPQHIITGYPGPVIHNLGGQPEKKGSMFNREEFGEMMMMQNAQMHQMVMQKMMLGNLGRQDYWDRRDACHDSHHDSCHDSCHGSHNSCHDCHSGCCSSHGVHGYCGHGCLPEQPLLQVPRVAGGAVHHHHYSNPPSQPAPAVTHYTTVPAMDIRGGYGGYPYREEEKETKEPGTAKKTVKQNSKKSTFPGSKALRRFRHAALVVVFIAHLRANVKKNLSNRPSSTFLFGIILKEIVAALHRIYLNPNGNIYPVLNDIIGPNCYDLASLVHGGPKDPREESVLIQELQYCVENVIYHITEIMPSTGVLGCHRKSAVFELIRSGKRFPNGYFWQVEMDRLQFTENGRTHNVSDSESFMLMLGIFISRSLVTTILMKPVDYGLSSEPLSEIAERNLRILASTILFLVRRISIQRGRGIMDMPAEISKYLYSDNEMQYVYSKLSRTFNYCEGLLREWGTEYIRRIRASSMQA